MNPFRTHPTQSRESTQQHKSQTAYIEAQRDGKTLVRSPELRRPSSEFTS